MSEQPMNQWMRARTELEWARANHDHFVQLPEGQRLGHVGAFETCPYPTCSPAPAPAPVVAEVRRAPIDLEAIQKRAKDIDYGVVSIEQICTEDVPVLLAEVARLTAELEKSNDRAKAHFQAFLDEEDDMEALRTRLRGLEQQWRARGMICCPETKQPRAGWSQQEYVERLGGAILLQHADELARQLTTPEEPK